MSKKKSAHVTYRKLKDPEVEIYLERMSEAARVTEVFTKMFRDPKSWMNQEVRQIHKYDRKQIVVKTLKEALFLGGGRAIYVEADK
jgi:hypothetical protein